MVTLQRRIKTILMSLLLIYLCLNIYHTSQSILRNEAQIALLKAVLNKPLCMAHHTIIERLKRLTKDLTYIRMSVDRDVAMAKIIEGHYDNLRKLLREIELITSSTTDEEHQRRFDRESKKSNIVCPEEYKGSIHGYPFYRKGFETEKCSLTSNMKDLVTLIFDEVVIPRTTGDDKPSVNGTGYVSRLFSILQSANQLFPGITMHVLLGKNWSQSVAGEIKKNTVTLRSNTKISFYYLRDSLYNKGEILQNLIDQVSTDYVLLAPDLANFTEDINLERLVRVLSIHEHLVFAGGSVRNLTGHWTNGCLQSQLRNYTLTYRTGYFHSFSECLVCDYISGPFLAKTSALRQLGIHGIGAKGIYRELFLRLKEHRGQSRLGRTVVSCPDVMFYSQPQPVQDEDLLSFANKHEIKKIIEADGRVRWFGCRRGIRYRNGEKCPFKVGLVVPPCCLENLADAIKFVMDQCTNIQMVCELQEGTLLGAVKLNKVLPWERDADIAFLTADFPKLIKIKDVFAKRGYVVHRISEFNA